MVRTRSGTHGRKSPEEVGECVGADEGSSSLRESVEGVQALGE